MGTVVREDKLIYDHKYLNLTLKFGIFTRFQEINRLRCLRSFPGVTIATVARQDKLSNIKR